MKKVIVIVGPTGVGKTKLSIELAKDLDGEVINADSTQIYRDLNIGTAKVTEEEKEGIKHHLFDIKNIDEDYSVFDYQRDGRKILDSLLDENKTPIVVGGTGLYIKALLYDYAFESANNNLNTYDEYDNDKLYSMLKEIDPNTSIHPNNRKRVIRAINYYKETGKCFSSKEKTDKLLYDCIFIGLTCDRDILYERINNRVDKMINEGLMDEALKIYNTNIRSKAVMTPICYKELFEYFDHNKNLEDQINLIKQRSRNYAKRQYTWFNNQLDVKWINVNFDNFDFSIKEALNYINAFK